MLSSAKCIAHCIIVSAQKKYSRWFECSSCCHRRKIKHSTLLFRISVAPLTIGICFIDRMQCFYTHYVWMWFLEIQSFLQLLLNVWSPADLNEHSVFHIFWHCHQPCIFTDFTAFYRLNKIYMNNKRISVVYFSCKRMNCFASCRILYVIVFQVCTKCEQKWAEKFPSNETNRIQITVANVIQTEISSHECH